MEGGYDRRLLSYLNMAKGHTLTFSRECRLTNSEDNVSDSRRSQKGDLMQESKKLKDIKADKFMSQI